MINGLFSGAEIAILSIRRTRLRQLVEDGNRGARAVEELRADPERFLATVQVGITVVGATAAAFGGASVALHLEPWIASVPPLAEHAEEIALGLVVLGVSFLSLVLGELVPKSLALQAAEPYALLVGRPLSALAWVARPLIWALTKSSNAVLRLFGDRTSFTEARLSSEELRQLVDEASAAGTVDPAVNEIVSRALEFAELDVAALMVPRGEMITVSKAATPDEVADTIARHGHARLPVWEGEPDNVVGLVNVRELLGRWQKDQSLTLDRVLHPIPFVPDTMAAVSALRTLREQRSRMAVVVDERGMIRGLVTLEDIVQELVGDFLSEGDSPRSVPRRELDGSIVLPGSLPIHEANRDLGLELPDGEEVTTVGGLCVEHAGRIPVKGEVLRIGSLDVEIVEATHRRVKAVRLRGVAAGG